MGQNRDFVDGLQENEEEDAKKNYTDRFLAVVLAQFLARSTFQQCLVFSNYQARAEHLSDKLTSNGWPAICIAGTTRTTSSVRILLARVAIWEQQYNLTDNYAKDGGPGEMLVVTNVMHEGGKQRLLNPEHLVVLSAGKQSQAERLNAMKKLKDFKCRVLISTDLIARGIDCDKVDLVVNLDLPWDTETYLHRVGRAGRFGGYATALSLVTEEDELKKLKRISEEIGYDMRLLSDDFDLDADESVSTTADNLKYVDSSDSLKQTVDANSEWEVPKDTNENCGINNDQNREAEEIKNSGFVTSEPTLVCDTSDRKLCNTHDSNFEDITGNGKQHSQIEKLSSNDLSYFSESCSKNVQTFRQENEHIEQKNTEAVDLPALDGESNLVPTLLDTPVESELLTRYNCEPNSEATAVIYEHIMPSFKEKIGMVEKKGLNIIKSDHCEDSSGEKLSDEDRDVVSKMSVGRLSSLPCNDEEESLGRNSSFQVFDATDSGYVLEKTSQDGTNQTRVTCAESDTIIVGTTVGTLSTNELSCATDSGYVLEKTSQDGTNQTRVACAESDTVVIGTTVGTSSTNELSCATDSGYVLEQSSQNETIQTTFDATEANKIIVTTTADNLNANKASDAEDNSYVFEQTSQDGTSQTTYDATELDKVVNSPSTDKTLTPGGCKFLWNSFSIEEKKQNLDKHSPEQFEILVTGLIQEQFDRVMNTKWKILEDTGKISNDNELDIHTVGADLMAVPKIEEWKADNEQRGPQEDFPQTAEAKHLTTHANHLYSSHDWIRENSGPKSKNSSNKSVFSNETSVTETYDSDEGETESSYSGDSESSSEFDQVTQGDLSDSSSGSENQSESVGEIVVLRKLQLQSEGSEYQSSPMENTATEDEIESLTGSSSNCADFAGHITKNKQDILDQPSSLPHTCNSTFSQDSNSRRPFVGTSDNCSTFNDYRCENRQSSIGFHYDNQYRDKYSRYPLQYHDYYSCDPKSITDGIRANSGSESDIRLRKQKTQMHRSDKDHKTAVDYKETRFASALSLAYEQQSQFLQSHLHHYKTVRFLTDNRWVSPVFPNLW